MAAIGRIESSKKALSLLRRVVQELRTPPASGRFSKSGSTYLIKQYRDHQLTARKLCKAPNELEHLMDSYHEYLSSSRKLKSLLATYKGKGDRSIEESANLVGLKLPKTTDDK